MAISIVSVDELQRLWEENRMDEKRAAKMLIEIVARRYQPKDPRLAGATSVIVKLLTPGGQQIGTVHEVVFEDGRPVAHSHPKDYVRRDCSRVRIEHSQEQAAAEAAHLRRLARGQGSSAAPTD